MWMVFLDSVSSNIREALWEHSISSSLIDEEELEQLSQLYKSYNAAKLYFLLN